MSFILYTGHLLLLLTPSTLALTLPTIRDFTNSPLLAPPTNKTTLGLVSLTADFVPLTPSLSLHADNADPYCDGNLLGFDMNRYSCLQAWNTIPTTNRQLTFGDRLSGTFDVQLPRRFSGRECVAFFS